ncbi:MAG TPA: DNA-directed RNA polymerase subunit omega [Chthoniobacterales bacterium]|nr:DNA-directed RNA polymerase subunit omega [Chthoniobacterales bacterium]
MKAELVTAACKVIPNGQILVNMVSRRVRQFTIGHRPMVEFAPGLGHADVALIEIAAGKLSFEFKAENGAAGSVEVVEFPGVIVRKKTKAAAA